MGKIYVIADTHFGSESIIRYEQRPFSDVSDMEHTLINNWNNTVSEEDTVFILGDFSVLSPEEDRRILSSLNGTKILIMGNHDTHHTPDEWRSLGFNECYMWPIIYDSFYMLSHEPLYINANMPYANIYGHVHANASYNTISNQSACVSVERTAYTPIAFEAIKKAIAEATQ